MLKMVEKGFIKTVTIIKITFSMIQTKKVILILANFMLKHKESQIF